MSSQRDKPSGGATSVEDAFRQLDMENYDNEPDDIVSRLLQVRYCSVPLAAIVYCDRIQSLTRTTTTMFH